VKIFLGLIFIAVFLIVISVPQTAFSQTTNSTSSGQGQSITVYPNHGPPGSGFRMYMTGFGITEFLIILPPVGITVDNTYIAFPKEAFVLSGHADSYAQPGTYTINVEFDKIEVSESGIKDYKAVKMSPTFTVTKVVLPTTSVNVKQGPTPLPQPQPGISKSTEKSTLPTISNTGKLTLPTTPGKSTGTLIQKPSTVHSCLKGSIMVNGNCVSKGKIVGILQ